MTRADAGIHAFADTVLLARTEKDVEKVIREAPAVYGPMSWRPVGNRPNNIGTIRMASDPALALIERITNGMDAILDLGHHLHPEDNPRSPRDAAKQWYGVPTAGIGEMSDDARRRIGELLQVALHESGEDKRPTIVIGDHGTGQSPVDFPATLMSLNESNKVGQPWTMGTYGQGGASTYGFSRATVVISRRHPDLRRGRDDLIGWTIVTEHEDDPEREILPSYRYLVGVEGSVPTLPPSALPDLAYGTRIIHIAYDLQGWSGPFTTGVWQLFHSALFDPVLPFLVTGTRAKEKSYGSRIVVGNAARLSRPDRARGDLQISHSDSAVLRLGDALGQVTLNYWVIQRPEGATGSSEPAASYVRADSAVAMTLFGQRQDTESRVWIKDRGKLPFLYKNMIVQLDADKLTPIAKREVFASTRERATQSELRTSIYDHLAKVLLDDPELRRLDHEEKERLLRRSTTAANEKVRQRLARFIKTRLKDETTSGEGGSGTGNGGVRGKRPGKPTPPRDIDDSMLHNVPRHMKFGRSDLQVARGATTHMWVDIDAKNGYLPSHDDDLSFEWAEGTDGAVRQSMRSKLLGGKSRWYFEASDRARVGSYGFRAILATANGVLEDSAQIHVVEPPESQRTKPGKSVPIGPRIAWVQRDDWGDELDEQTVGYVTEDDEETVIWVNRDFRQLDKAMSGRGLTADAIQTRADRYLLPVACALWLQHHEMKSADPRPSDLYLKRELQRMAEAVLVAIDPDADVASAAGD